MTIKNALLLAAFILGLAWLLALGVSNDVLEDTTGERLMGAANGLILAAFGNLIPKQIGRSGKDLDPVRAQAMRRFAGWTFTLAGLGYAVVRLTFPIDIVRPVSMSLVAGSVVVVLAGCFLFLRKPPASARS